MRSCGPSPPAPPVPRPVVAAARLAATAGWGGVGEGGAPAAAATSALLGAPEEPAGCLVLTWGTGCARDAHAALVLLCTWVRGGLGLG